VRNSDDAVAAFLSSLAAERGAAKNTLDAYRRDLSDYESTLRSYKLNPATAERNDVESYMAGMAAQGFASTTRARRLSAIKQLHAFMYAEGWRDSDPAAPVRGPGRPRRLPKTLSTDDVSRLIQAAHEGNGHAAARRACLIEILYATGLRVTELVSLPVGQMRRNPQMIRVKGKGEKERLAPLSDRARAAITAYLPLRDASKEKDSLFMFPSRGKLGHLTRERFYQMIRELALKAGLDPSGISPHTMRHAFATHMLANGADLRVIQTLLGHADIATTEIYTHVMEDSLRELVLEKHPLAVATKRS
jgi:integrase/recombinase XerD